MKKTLLFSFILITILSAFLFFPSSLQAQINKKIDTLRNPSRTPCIITGCSGQICADREVSTTCEVKPEYACYQQARCERQADGQCGWTQTPEFQKCLNQKTIDDGSILTPTPLPTCPPVPTCPQNSKIPCKIPDMPKDCVMPMRLQNQFQGTFDTPIPTKPLIDEQIKHETPQVPLWIKILPPPMGNFVEMLYVWRYFFNKDTDKDMFLRENTVKKFNNTQTYQEPYNTMLDTNDYDY